MEVGRERSTAAGDESAAKDAMSERRCPESLPYGLIHSGEVKMKSVPPCKLQVSNINFCSKILSRMYQP